MFKQFINDLSTFEEERVSKYRNNSSFLKQIRRLSNIMKKDAQHIKCGKLIQRSTATKLQ